MGLIERIFGGLFGNDRNTIVETIEVFRENAEKGAGRDADKHIATLEQFAHEFRLNQRSWFDRAMDAINRVPRPAMALGTLGLFVAAMVDPVWFAARMQGIALVPEPLWWLLGAIVSFYFGARHQSKGQQFQREMAQTISRVPGVVHNLRSLEKMDADEGGAPVDNDDKNPALKAWRGAA